MIAQEQVLSFFIVIFWSLGCLSIGMMLGRAMADGDHDD